MAILLRNSISAIILPWEWIKINPSLIILGHEVKMIFNSLQYAVFLSVIVMLYFLIPQKFRWIFLLGISYYFYSRWNVEYALLLLLSTAVTYITAIFIAKAKEKKKKIIYLVSCLVINLGILFVFKYFNFFNATLADLTGLMGLNYKPAQLSLLLPVGISFYTFQALGYVIDVYKGKSEPMKHFGKYALFVSFFPQIAAGPIGRIESLRPQFDFLHSFDFDRIRSGLLQIALGLFKKLVIADRLAILVNTVYNEPAAHHGMSFVLASVFYSFQIYCDFSGYSDMAIGSARLLGIELMENFRRPYLSDTVAGFWKRWHISLTSWFRDYLYIPLGGNRKRHLINIIIVFLISGLWHGASLTFVIWGLLNGLYQVAGIIIKPFTDKLKTLFKVTGTSMTFKFMKRMGNFGLITFAWIFFRANSMGDLKIILSRLFTLNMSFFSGFNTDGLGMGRFELIFSALLIITLMLFEMLQEKTSVEAILRKEPLIFRWAVYLAIIAIIIVFGVYGDANSTQFIYFNF